MYCRKCGEENPENAVYCKNCGSKLKEEPKKAEIIETTTSQQNESNNRISTDNNSIIGCCLCLVGIFIIFAILGMLGF